PISPPDPYTLSLHDALPISLLLAVTPNETGSWQWDDLVDTMLDTFRRARIRAVEPDALGTLFGVGTLLPAVVAEFGTSAASVSLDRKSTRLNSSHLGISYAV